MKKVLDYITKAVTDSVTQFKNLATQAGEHGKLTSFVSAITTAMNKAKSTIATAVQAMIAELEKLNRTFEGPTITEPKTSGGSASAPASFSPDPPPTLMAMAQPVSLTAAAAADTGSAAASSLAAGVSSAAGSINSASQPASAGAGVTKIYNITINAAPDIPTEESLRKQLSYADALYE